jgi:hypothetical protein
VRSSPRAGALPKASLRRPWPFRRLTLVRVADLPQGALRVAAGVRAPARVQAVGPRVQARAHRVDRDRARPLVPLALVRAAGLRVALALVRVAGPQAARVAGPQAALDHRVAAVKMLARWTRARMPATRVTTQARMLARTQVTMLGSSLMRATTRELTLVTMRASLTRARTARSRWTAARRRFVRRVRPSAIRRATATSLAWADSGPRPRRLA